jgi:response regulator RpfG family c-di-GMP phosphodiesterase
MYPLYRYSSDIWELRDYLFITNANVTIDIFLRTVVLVVFYIALYSSVSIGQMMNNKRKEELIKRRGMERDFKAVVGDVFDVINVFNSHTINQNKEAVHRIAEVASRLGRMLGLNNQVCNEIYEYSVIHIDQVKSLNILEYENKETLTEKDYTDIREKTILGSVIIKRLQLNQKSEDIVRAHFEKTVDTSFTEKMKRVQRSQEGQIILLAEMYDIMRSERNYKKKLRHKRAVDLLQLEFKEYFEPYILDRFLRYQMDFEKVYDSYKLTGSE